MKKMRDIALEHPACTAPFEERITNRFSVITQCSIRHLYTAEPKDEAVIDQAKTYERRRCNHHTLENPLTTLECFKSVIDPNDNGVNKHRYIVASQDSNVRAHLRRIPGVPLVYINRSVMIMEPMANATEELRDKEEKSKFRAGLTNKRGVQLSTLKRKREDQESGKNINAPFTHPAEDAEDSVATNTRELSQKKKTKGPKGPNPLSVKKPKKREAGLSEISRPSDTRKLVTNHNSTNLAGTSMSKEDDETEDQAKKKRKRKHKPRAKGQQSENVPEIAESGDP